MIRLLVTGFGAFPGVRRNPTLALLAALDRRRARFARFGIALELHALPVIYDGLSARLDDLIKTIKPDAILMFGLASRRTHLSIESQARNRAKMFQRDAQGAYPPAAVLLSGAPQQMKTRMPAQGIIAAWRRAGITGTPSRDAGDYLCNANLYLCLNRPIGAVGFIHIPYPRKAGAEKDARPRFTDIVAAADIAIIHMARAARLICLSRASR
jgi:pyroglutamyl-peptidase